MSAPPFMPLYVGDYLADTTHLTCTEHGAYILLLMAMWRAGGSLPDDPSKLARFARCTTGQWARMSATILDFFEQEDGRIVHRRLAREMTKHGVAVERQRQLSSNGGKAKALKTNKPSMPHGTFSECQPEPEPELEKKVVSKPKGFSPHFAQFWSAYPNKVGKVKAEVAYVRALARVNGPDPPGELLSGLERAKVSDQWRRGYIPHPTTWLNEGRWEDEPATVIPMERRPTSVQSPDRRLADRHENYARAFAGASAVARRQGGP